MSASTRITVSVRLTERQLVETIRCLESADLSALDSGAAEAHAAALLHFRDALRRLQERVR